MGLFDAVAGIGEAISDGASSIAMAPTQAINFAKGIADKAENFVEERVGPTGAALLGAAANLVESPLGFVPSVVSSLIGGLADPMGFVNDIVESAERESSSALAFAQENVNKLVDTTLSGVGSLFTGAVSGIKAIAKGMEAGVRFAGAGLVNSYLLGIKLARAEAMGLLKFDAWLTKEAIAYIAKRRIEQVHKLTAQVKSLTERTTAALGKLTIKAFDRARQRATRLALNVHKHATRLVTQVVPKILRLSTKVMIVTNKAAAKVHAAVVKAKSVLPSPFYGPLNRIDAFTRTIASKATQFHVIYTTRVMPATMNAYAALERNMWPILAEANHASYRVENRILTEIYTQGDDEAKKIQQIGRRLEEKIAIASNSAQKNIDLGVDAVEFGTFGTLASAGEDAAAGAKTGGAGGGAEKGGQDHAARADDKVREHTGIPKGGGPVPVPHSTGKITKKTDVGAHLGEQGDKPPAGKKGQIVDPLLMTRHMPAPSDGDLTGPFYPDDWAHEPYKSAEDALTHNSEVTIYVNGVKTSLAAHIAAAAALARQRKKPVVGVYNQSDGMVADLAQCVADKAGFQLAMRNPAVRQMVRIVDNYGSSLDIVAHSQGSIIVSSALQIAQMGHGKEPGADLGGIEFTSLGNAIATRPKGLKDFHAYSFDNDMVSGSVGSTGFTPMITKLMSASSKFGFGPDLLGQNMTTADTDTTTLHNTTNPYRAHGVLPDQVKGKDGKLVDDGAPSYITSLSQFEDKEREWRAARKAHPALMAGADAANNILNPIRSTGNILFTGARGVAEFATPYVQSGYGTMDRGARNLGSGIQSGVSSAYSGLDESTRSFGQGVQSRFSRASTGVEQNINSMSPGWTRSILGTAWGGAESAGRAASNLTSGAYNLGDRLLRGAGSTAAGMISSTYGAGDASIRAAGSSISAVGSGMNWLYERASSGLSAVMRSPTGPMPDDERVAQGLGGLRSPGQPIPGDVTSRLAPFVGFDASFARVHTDPEAGAAANTLRAEAFATGRDVYFAPGNYDPHSPRGLSLLAHELTHVAQQSGSGAGGVQRARSTGFSSDLMEAEAQEVATNVLSNLGTPNGLHVDKLYKTYKASEGIGKQDSGRLDRIGDMALRKAELLVGDKHGLINQVNVTVELDLGRMSDEEAATEWANAVVAAIRQLPVLPHPSVPVPKQIQKEPVYDKPVKNPLPQDIQTAIEADVEVIAKELQAWFTDRALIMGIIDKWAQLDKDTAGRYDTPSRHLDYLFTRMLIRTYDKGTISTIYVNSLDETYRMLSGNTDYGPRLLGYMRASKKYSNFKPDKEQEGVASYVARHTLMGALGILKAMGGAIMGLGQAALWAEWKAITPHRHALVWSLEKASKIFGADLKSQIGFFKSDDPPKADDAVAENFDETAKIIIGWMGDIPDQERKQLFEEFTFGNKWGAIPANLMMLGAGSGGLTSKGAQFILKGLMIAQTVKGIDDARKALSNRIAELQKLHPEMGFWEIVTDGEVLKQMTTIVVSAVSLGTNVAEADEKAKGILKVLQGIGFALDWGQLGPIVKKAYDDYHDTALNEDQRKEKLEQDAIDFVNQVLAAINSTKSKVEEHQKAAAQKAAAEKAQAAADKPVPLPVLPPAGNEPAPAPASQPVQGDTPAKASEPQAASGTGAPLPPAPVIPTPPPTPPAPTPTSESTQAPAATGKVATEPVTAPPADQAAKASTSAEKAVEAKAAEPAAGPPATPQTPGGKKIVAVAATGAAAAAGGQERPSGEGSGRPIVPEPTIPPPQEKLKVGDEQKVSEAQQAKELEAKAAEEPAPKSRRQQEEELKAKHWAILEDLAAAKPKLGEATEVRNKAESALKDAETAAQRLKERPANDPDLIAANRARDEAKAKFEDAVKAQNEADKALEAVEKRQIEARKELGIPAPEGLRAIVDGTRGEQMAAAKDIILNSKSWKDGLRKLVAGMPSKSERAVVEAMFDRARGQIIAEAHAKVLAEHPEMADLKLNTPGTPGFNSDIDAGINPKVRPSKEELAGVVKRSAEMVKLMNDELRARTGGEPDLTLDTNMYSWTGSDVLRNEVSASKEGRAAQDVASIAELRQKRDPKEWAKIREDMIAKAAEKGGPKAAAAMEAQLTAGEEVAAGLKKQISEARKKYMKDNPKPKDMPQAERNKIAEMRAREIVATNLRNELASILSKPEGQWDYKRITELQTQVAMAEPGAYASRAGVDEIVEFGQPLVSLSGEKAREHYMTAERPMTPRELSNSAASSLAQLEDHSEHHASNKIEADELVKNAMKYSERIYNEARKSGRDSGAAAGAPELDMFYRKGGKGKGRADLIEWFAEQQKEPLPSVPKEGATAEQKAAYEAAYVEMANKYAEKQLQWARDMVAELKAEAIVDDLKSSREEAKE